MKLQRKVTDNERVHHEYLLISGITDDDAGILLDCGLTPIPDYDEKDDDGNICEAWIDAKYVSCVE